MKALRGAAALRNLRELPLWRLLAADKAPVVLAILQGLLVGTEKTLPSETTRAAAPKTQAVEMPCLRLSGAVWRNQRLERVKGIEPSS